MATHLSGLILRCISSAMQEIAWKFALSSISDAHWHIPEKHPVHHVPSWRFCIRPYPATYSQQAIEFTRKLDDGRQPELWNEAAACLHLVQPATQALWDELSKEYIVSRHFWKEEQRQRRVGRWTIWFRCVHMHTKAGARRFRGFIVCFIMLYGSARRLYGFDVHVTCKVFQCTYMKLYLEGSKKQG